MSDTISEFANNAQRQRTTNIIVDDTVLAESVGLDGSHWQLCLRLLDRKSTEWAPLQELADASGGVNPFYEPSFMLALRGKMMRAKDFHLILFEGVDEKRRAKLAFPVFEINAGKGKRYLKAYENDYAPLSTPHVDLVDAPETIYQFTELLAEAVEKHQITIRIQTLCDDSEFARIFPKQIEQKTDIQTSVSNVFSRAGLHPVSGKKGGLSGFNQKRQREFKRLEKKLSEIGDVEFECVTQKLDVLLRFEEFLLLEMKGWKGRKGTSMQLLKKTSAFARMAVTELADRGNAEIFSMRLDGKSIATIIVYKSEGRYYPWKIAFDEDYAHRSPGSLLMYMLTREILDRPDFVLADSLARPGQSWVSNIWNDELAYSDIIVGPNEADITGIANTGKFKNIAKQWLRKIINIK